MKINAGKLSVKLSEPWFDQLPVLQKDVENQPEDVVMSLKAEAQNIFHSETKLYQHMKEDEQDKDFLWVKKILHTGTLSDKVSAHTVLIQNSPVYNFKSIETLINMVTIKGKRECLLAMDALLDLFLNNLLPRRKLRNFNEQPLTELQSLSKKSPVLRNRIIVLWLYEEQLKSFYKQFLLNLNAVSRDTIEKTKHRSVDVMFNLLKEKPEQEQLLLEFLVNKIGDPLPKIGSHTCYLLGRLLLQHEKMKSIVVLEVERLLFRKNISDRAKYYSLCFLNQIILNNEEDELANHLIKIYFCQFKYFVQQGEVNNKMMSALLTGVSRAYPYAKLKDNVVMEQLDAMYRLIHMVNFNISVQALMLIFQVLDSQDSVSDRFYCALYRKLFDPAVGNSSKQAALLNLVYRAMKKDSASVRVRAFVKRLLQIALYQSPNLQCGILLLLSKIGEIHPNVFMTAKSFECDSDSDEYYEDAPDEQEEVSEVYQKRKAIGVKTKTEPSWHHKQMKKRTKTFYDPNARNPLHAGASFSNLWELLYLKRSFHPSVSMFANQFSNLKEIKYSGDPLLDFTLARFLDRFVFKNPKKKSEFMKDAHTKVFGPRKVKSVSKQKLFAINSQEYLQQNSERIPVEEKFIYDYLKQRSLSGKASRDDSDIESVCSEDFEKLLDNIHPEDDSLNFFEELGVNKAKKKAKRKKSEESDEDSIEENDEDLSDFDQEAGDFEEELNKEFEDIEDICEEDFDELETDFSQKPTKKKRKRESGNADFVDGDEFSAMLEENSGSKIDTITGEGFVTKDKAGAKQIAWEVERHRKFKGSNWRKKKNFRKNKKFKK